jgi:hypothetical protein
MKTMQTPTKTTMKAKKAMQAPTKAMKTMKAPTKTTMKAKKAMKAPNSAMKAMKAPTKTMKTMKTMKAPTKAMEPPHMSEHGPPRFQAAVAVGSPDTWQELQLHTRLPHFAVLTNPNLGDTALSWIRDFLRLRRYDANTTLEDAFISFEICNDIMGGYMVQAELKDDWKKHDPQGEWAYHGCNLAAIYSVLCRGLRQGPARKKASNGDPIGGVFVHKHGSRHKARSYMKYFMFPEGFMVSVLLKCRVADPPIRRTCPPDHWCLPDDGVQVETVYFHFIRFEDCTPFTFWTWGLWEPRLEANPWSPLQVYPRSHA